MQFAAFRSPTHLTSGCFASENSVQYNIFEFHFRVFLNYFEVNQLVNNFISLSDLAVVGRSSRIFDLHLIISQLTVGRELFAKSGRALNPLKHTLTCLVPIKCFNWISLTHISMYPRLTLSYILFILRTTESVQGLI